MSEWVLVPESFLDVDLKCTRGHDRCDGGAFEGCPYCERVARPPMPRPVFDAMVERMARTIREHESSKGRPIYEDEWLLLGQEALRAAHPGLIVEGE